jgi:hypothetical protein
MLAILAASLLHALSPSSNWAGYAVSGATFTDVKRTWVQPAVACPSAPPAYAAFWVGLGGAAGGDGGLEQTGTEADCEGGQASYHAWYEILPAASVNVPVTITPGDTVSAEVSVDGPVATLTLTDVTTGETFTTQSTPSVLDTASAEWIAEAPSRCFGSRCLTLQLANFGTVQFSGSTTTANGHVGTISDASWSATSIELGGTAGSAEPAALSGDGSRFTVAYTQVATQVQEQSPTPMPKAKAHPKKKPKPKRRNRPD